MLAGFKDVSSHLAVDGSHVLTENRGFAFRPSPCLSNLTLCLLPCLPQVRAAEQHSDGSPKLAQL